MKSLRALLFLSLALSFSCVHTGTMKWTKSVPNILADAKESIFMVITPITKEKIGVGNAFMIEPGVLMTAGHVCAGDVGTMLFINTDKKTYGGTVVFKDKDADACIIESDVSGRPLTMLAEVDNYGHGYAVSYEILGIGPPSFKLFIREVHFRNELPSVSENPPDGIGKRLFADGQFQKGNSGSPVLNDDGYVIGLLSAVAVNDENDRVGNGIAVLIDPRTLYAVRQQYREAKKERLPVPLPLPPPPMKAIKFPGESK